MRAPPLVLEWTEAALSLRCGDDVLRRVEVVTDDDIETYVRDVAAIPESACGDSVVLQVHSPVAQVRTLRNVPPVGARDLPSLVQSQHRRYFRTTPADPAVAAAWVLDADDQRVVRAASISFVLLERIESALAEEGLRLREIHPVYGGEELPLRFHTRKLAGQHRAKALLTRVMMLVLALAGWLGAGAVYLGDLMSDEREMVREWAALDRPLDQLTSVEDQLDAFLPFAAAVQRQSDDGERLTPIMGAVARMLPRDVHLHSLVIERAGPIRLAIHGPDPVAVVQALSDWWSGVVRLERGQPLEGQDAPPVFTVILERAK